MKKNITVLTGSYRQNGNSSKLAESFIYGATEKGHNIIKVITDDLNINDCLGCDCCWTKTGFCIQQDDMTKVHASLINADVLVFVSPLYFFGMTAKLRCAIDRMHTYYSDGCEEPLKIKECALLMCGRCDSEKYFSGAIDTYKHTAEYLNWEDRGIVLVTGVLNKDDILANDGLKKAFDLGLSM